MVSNIPTEGLLFVGWCRKFLLRGCNYYRSDGVEYSYLGAVIGRMVSNTFYLGAVIGRMVSNIPAEGL
jgi:hypothetical protein